MSLHNEVTLTTFGLDASIMYQGPKCKYMLQVNRIYVAKRSITKSPPFPNFEPHNPNNPHGESRNKTKKNENIPIIIVRPKSEKLSKSQDSIH